MSQAGPAKLPASSAPFRARSASLQRTPSIVEPAASIVTLPEIERGPSRVSRHETIHERRESGAFSEKDEEAVEDGTYRAEEVTFPDGGLKAWLCVVGAFWTVFCGFGLAGAMGAFQTLYRTTFLTDYTESEIAWIISVQAFFTFGLACFSGSLFDSYGHRPLIASGTFCLVLGFCMLSLCTQYYQFFIVHATLIAWGSNLFQVFCPMGVLGQWFYNRRGLAFGLMSTGSSLGSVVWPILLANLPDKVGFGWTCRVMALICLFCGVISYTLLRTRLPRKPRGAFFYTPAFRNIQYNLAVLNFWTCSFGFFCFMTFIGTYGQLVGLGAFAPYLLVIQNGSSIAGRLIAGFLADVVGIYNVTLTSSIVMTIMFFIWLACDQLYSCIILVVIMGIFGGAFVSLQAPLATKTATDMRFGGTMVGQALFVQSFSQLVCGPIFGAVLGKGSEADRLARFPYAIILGGIMMVIATTALTGARYKAVGWKIRVKT